MRFFSNFVHFLSRQPNFYQVVQFVDRTRTMRRFFAPGVVFLLRPDDEYFSNLLIRLLRYIAGGKQLTNIAKN